VGCFVSEGFFFSRFLGNLLLDPAKLDQLLNEILFKGGLFFLGIGVFFLFVGRDTLIEIDYHFEFFAGDQVNGL
jgi:hypothetical protein